MRLTRHSNPPFWEGRVKKLPMAAFRTPQLPSLLLEPLKNLANLHCVSVSKRARTVNAEPRELRHAGPTSVNHEAELDRPARVAWSDLLDFNSPPLSN
jgi:hypothetical protein